ncbi:MAG: AAA family ATPase [Terricaulis sp.]
MSLDHEPPRYAHGNGATVLRLPQERDSGEPRRKPLSLEWAEAIEPQDGAWLVKGIVPASGLMCMYGPSRGGKSFLALEWCLRIAHGDDILGHRTKQTGVAYVGAEAANGLRKRVRAWMQENGRDDEPPPFALIPRGVDFSSPEASDVDELIDLLTEAAIEFKERGERLGVVVVDTLARATPGADENSGADMGAAMAAMEKIGEALGVLVILVHHTGKDATKGARGHSSLFAALDTAIELQHDEETGGRSIRLAKQKDDEDGGRWGFRLKSVSIGTDGDGDPLTSCVIEYVDAPQARRRDSKQAASEAIALEALRAVLSTDARKAPAGVPAAAGAYVAPLLMVRDRAYRLGLSQEGETTAAKRTRWNRALENLSAQKIVRVWKNDTDGEGWLWLA